MKSLVFNTQIVLTLIFASIGFNGISQTIWNGSFETFEKESNSDWTLEENQDRITDLVWITRKSNQGLFNIATETGYQMNESPAGTEWAMGTTDDLGILVFSDWRGAVDNNPAGSLNMDMVLHLIEENIYIDLVFQEWQAFSGGAFAYKRRTDPALSLTEQTQTKQVFIFPNPSQDYLKLTEYIGVVSYSIFNAQGELVAGGEWDTSTTADISLLASGMYFLQSGDFTFRFVKNVK